MKRIFSLIITLTLCCCAFAQGNNGGQNWQGGRSQHHAHNGSQRGGFNPEQFFKDMKDYVAEKAQLTPAEVTKAFPIVREMLGKQYEQQAKQHELARKRFGGQQLSDAEYGKIVEQTLSIEVEMKKIEERYYKKLHDVLSWQKVFRVRDAINGFHMEALRKFQRGPGGNRPRPNFGAPQEGRK